MTFLPVALLSPLNLDTDGSEMNEWAQVSGFIAPPSSTIHCSIEIIGYCSEGCCPTLCLTGEQRMVSHNTVQMTKSIEVIGHMNTHVIAIVIAKLRWLTTLSQHVYCIFVLFTDGTKRQCPLSSKHTHTHTHSKVLNTNRLTQAFRVYLLHNLYYFG